jgi:hypothetical protein
MRRTPITNEDIEAYCDSLRERAPTKAIGQAAVNETSLVLRDYQRWADLQNIGEKHHA